MVSLECIIAFSELTRTAQVRTNDINNTNNDVGDLIGEYCFEQLCAALSSALDEANAANENGGTATPMDFLAEKWKAIITNRHFKTWYANRVAYHWFEGSSITSIAKAGLITQRNNDEEYKNGFSHAEEKQRKRLSETAAKYAGMAKAKFLEHFWNACGTEYDCKPDCGCNDKETTAGRGIKMTAC